jgi:hypothetical protein
MGFGSFIKKAVGTIAPVVGAATGNPILAAAGTAIGGALSTQDQQDFALASAQRANEFTKEQLQNRHQWEVADLRAAGLNPILSAMKGAPSIGGSAQAVSNATAAGDAASLTSSAAAAKNVELSQKKLQSEIDVLKSQKTKNLAEARNVGNIANVNQLKGNLASGLHGITSNTAEVIDAITSGKPPKKKVDWSKAPKGGFKSRKEYLEYYNKHKY